MSSVVFTNVQIFDGTGRACFPGEVSITDNRIEAVTNSSSSGSNGSQSAAVVDRGGAEVIDGNAMTLMPGMVESHAHLTWPSSVERIVNAMTLPIEEHLLVTAQNARITLDHGFTSAYSAGSLGERFEVTLRDMIDAGHLPGPRLRASSLEKGAEGVIGVPEGHDPTHDRDIPGLRNYIQSMAELGVNSIKFLMSSDEAFAPGGAQTLMYSEEEAQAIGQAASEAGVWLACHAQAAEAVKRALRAGFRSIYHCTYADDEALDMLEANRDEIFMSPAAGLLYARVYEAQAFGIGRNEAEKMGAVSGLELLQQIIPELRQRGVRVLPGGDYGFPYNPVGRNARDLDLFVDLFGYTPTEVLVAATKTGGELMGMDVGEIKPGMLADLLLVDGDPTTDVRILQDKARIPVVMKDGRFHRREAIDDPTDPGEER